MSSTTPAPGASPAPALPTPTNEHEPSAAGGGLRYAGIAIGRGRLAPHRLIFVSGDLRETPRRIGDAARLPPTLVIHHRNDACSKTSPQAVEPFRAWSGGTARVLWLDGGADAGDPCGPRSHHGLSGLDSAVVEAIATFAR